MIFLRIIFLFFLVLSHLFSWPQDKYPFLTYDDELMVVTVTPIYSASVKQEDDLTQIMSVKVFMEYRIEEGEDTDDSQIIPYPKTPDFIMLKKLTAYLKLMNLLDRDELYLYGATWFELMTSLDDYLLVPAEGEDDGMMLNRLAKSIEDHEQYLESVEYVYIFLLGPEKQEIRVSSTNDISEIFFNFFHPSREIEKRIERVLAQYGLELTRGWRHHSKSSRTKRREQNQFIKVLESAMPYWISRRLIRTDSSFVRQFQQETREYHRQSRLKTRRKALGLSGGTKMSALAPTLLAPKVRESPKLKPLINAYSVDDIIAEVEAEDHEGDLLKAPLTAEEAVLLESLIMGF